MKTIGTPYDVPDYVWIPPELQVDFQNLPSQGNIPSKTLGGGLSQYEDKPNSDSGPPAGGPATKVPHPLSDYSHIDPGTAFFTNNPVVKNAPGFKRLEALYEFLLKGMVGRLNALNTATDQTSYTTARTAYLQFAADLDDAEQSSGVGPGGPGYGKAIKWFSVDPIIVKPASGPTQIKGVNFVIKWNPHSSSSSVTVP